MTRLGSFVSSHRPTEKAREIDRVLVRLAFKHKKLEKLAEENLQSRNVMALYSLTVNDFLKEVLVAMKAARMVHHSRVQIVFCGKSVPFPIHFSGSDYMEKVFKKICTIEESREFSRTSSNEELKGLREQATDESSTAQRENQPQRSA